jgi:hypothetical protein
MKGTEKQIAWAEKIKQSAINALGRNIDKIKEVGKEVPAKLKQYHDQLVADNDHDAAWWINNRDNIKSVIDQIAKECMTIHNVKKDGHSVMYVM